MIQLTAGAAGLVATIKDASGKVVNDYLVTRRVGSWLLQRLDGPGAYTVLAGGTACDCAAATFRSSTPCKHRRWVAEVESILAALAIPLAAPAAVG